MEKCHSHLLLSFHKCSHMHVLCLGNLLFSVSTSWCGVAARGWALNLDCNINLALTRSDRPLHRPEQFSWWDLMCCTFSMVCWTNHPNKCLHIYTVLLITIINFVQLENQESKQVSEIKKKDKRKCFLKPQAARSASVLMLCPRTHNTWPHPHFLSYEN